MPIHQFINSIRAICRNPHVSTFKGIGKHLLFQIRKYTGLFPFEQQLSKSIIFALNKKCGVSALINNQGMYDYNNMHLIKELLKEGSNFFDIGANIGSYTLIASEQESARVFAFEPYPFSFQSLKDNVERNGRSNVALFNIALGDRDGNVYFSDNPDSATNHIDKEDSEEAISVWCTRVDTFCEKRGVLPEIVKIDVEGFEYEVLKGFGKYLGSIDVIFIEMKGRSDKRFGRYTLSADAFLKCEKKMKELLSNSGLQGPYSLDYDEKTFTISRRNQEDVIFISSKTAGLLREMGFIFGG